MERLRTGFEWSNRTVISGTGEGIDEGIMPPYIKLQGSLVPYIYSLTPFRRLKDGTPTIYFNSASAIGLTGGYGADDNGVGFYQNLSGYNAIALDSVDFPNGFSSSHRTSSGGVAANEGALLDIKVSGDYYSISSTVFGAGYHKIRLYKNGVYVSGQGERAIFCNRSDCRITCLQDE